MRKNNEQSDNKVAVLFMEHKLSFTVAMLWCYSFIHEIFISSFYKNRIDLISNHFELTLKEVGGYYVLVAQEITCHFSQFYAKVMKIFD